MLFEAVGRSDARCHPFLCPHNPHAAVPLLPCPASPSMYNGQPHPASLHLSSNVVAGEASRACRTSSGE